VSTHFVCKVAVASAVRIEQTATGIVSQ